MRLNYRKNALHEVHDSRKAFSYSKMMKVLL